MAGETSQHGGADGAEDEQEPEDEQDHAGRDPAAQPSLPPQHPQVSRPAMLLPRSEAVRVHVCVQTAAFVVLVTG